MAHGKKMFFLALTAVVGLCLVYLKYIERNFVVWSGFYPAIGQSLLLTNITGIRGTRVTEEWSTSNGVIHVVMVFPLITSELWDGLGYNNSSAELRKKRQQEYEDCLRANLNIGAVKKIHLFSNQPEFLRRKVLDEYKLKAAKIQIHNSSLNPTYRELFEYASNFLQDKLVFVLNADNFMGEGFNNVSLDWWKKSGKVMYALTRHRLKPRPLDCQISPQGYCDPDGSYIGSHDGFMFYMRDPFPVTFLSELEFPSHVYGSENVVIWAFQTKLKFSVKNPCHRLAIYHNHCTDVRATWEHRTRVNTGGRSRSVKFSD